VNDLRKGAIVYIGGEAPDQWSMDDEVCFRKQISKFQSVRIITPEFSLYKIHIGWLQLISKGITDIAFIVAEFGNSGKLEFFGRICRIPIMGAN